MPLQWLRSELPYVLEMVAELAGQQDPGLGAFSCQEARKAWLDRHGNLDEAVQECVRARRRKVPAVLEAGQGCGLWASEPFTLLCLFFPFSLLLSMPNWQVQELRSLGFGPEEGSLQALFQHGGDVTRALTELQRQRLEPFHQRLWDSGPETTPSWDGPDKQVLGGGEEPTWAEGRLTGRTPGV